MHNVLQMLKGHIGGLGLRRPYCVSGRVSRFDGQIIECDGFPATIGTCARLLLKMASR